MTSESSGVGFESAPLLSFSLAQGGGKVFFRFSSMRSFSRLRRQLLTLAPSILFTSSLPYGRRRRSRPKNRAFLGTLAPFTKVNVHPRYKSPLLFRVSPQFLRKTPLVWRNCSPLFYTNGANVSFVLNFMRNNVCVFAEECLILRMEDAK